MSHEAVSWALDRAPMLRTAAGKPDTTARGVLVVRAERADELGRDSHASVADVMFRTGYDERTVQRAESRLQAAGLLVYDGTTRFGTTRWNLDMTLCRDEASDRAEIEAAIARRKADDAARQKAKRDQQKAAHLDAESRRLESASRHLDADSRRLDAVPPEPSLNRPEPSGEPPTGGAPPPDPRRLPPATPSGTEDLSSLSEPLTPAQDQPGESLPHAREREAELRLVADNSRVDPAPFFTPATLAAATQRRRRREAS